MDDDILICEWCDCEISEYEPKAQIDGDWMHVCCAQEEEDHASADWLLGL